MTAFGDYEQSYPPEILRGFEPPLVGATARLSATTGGTVVAAAGEPGSYTPDLAPADRPRNVTELRERARPADDAPWVEGAYVLVGTSGKRAHWGGDDWHGGESPGYPEPSPATAADTSSEVSSAAEDDASPSIEDDGDEQTEGGSDPA